MMHTVLLVVASVYALVGGYIVGLALLDRYERKSKEKRNGIQ